MKQNLLTYHYCNTITIQEDSMKTRMRLASLKAAHTGRVEKALAQALPAKPNLISKVGRISAAT